MSISIDFLSAKMEDCHQQTYSERIYYGLPVLQAEDETAVVTGANGVSGQAMLKLLLKSPRRWATIFAISQGESPIGVATDPRVQYIAADFLDKPDSIASLLKAKAVTSGQCFFFSYKDSTDPLVMQQVNGAMLKNFINATHIADAIPKRIVLQTGGKHYGVHQGTFSIPAEESDLRLDLGPNFYYRQEDILKDLGSKFRFDYVVVRPLTIIGALKGNYLNLAIALGLYLAVSKELGDAPIFNGNPLKYHSVETLSSSTMNAYLEEWCALTPACANQAFNATNGDSTVWARLFPDLCRYFDLEPPSENQFNGPAPRPLIGSFSTVRPLDYKENDTIELRNSLQQWAKEKRTLEAWERLSMREGLDEDTFKKASWGYADRNMAIKYSKIESLTKARKFGFLGYVDSTANFLEVLNEASDLNILPRSRGAEPT